MARRTRRPNLEHQRVLVAVDQDRPDRQDMARALALLPQPPAAARVEVREAGRARRRILRDRGEQPGGVEPGKERTPLFPRGNIVGRVGNRSDPFDL